MKTRSGGHAAFVCGLTLIIIAAGGMLAGYQTVFAEEENQEDRKITIAEGKFVLTAPEKWLRKEPKVRFIEHEFEVPAAKEDERPGRVTVMGAGGSVEENIERWFGQFEQPDGGDTEEAAKVEEIEVAEQQVHLVDVSGTYLDKPPFAAGRAIERKGYRLLGAIIITSREGKPTGNYFVKFVGPNGTVSEYEEAFRKMIEGLSRGEGG